MIVILEELIQSGYDVKIIYLDNIEQFKQHEKEINIINKQCQL